MAGYLGTNFAHMGASIEPILLHKIPLKDGTIMAYADYKRNFNGFDVAVQVCMRVPWHRPLVQRRRVARRQGRDAARAMFATAAAFNTALRSEPTIAH